MGRQEEIRQAFKRLAGEVGPAPTLMATVQDINAEDKTITLLDDDGLQYPGIRLRPVVDNNEGITIFPKLQTWCLALRIEDDQEWIAIAFGEIDKVRVVTGKSVFEINSSGFLIENGNENLKSILSDLVDKILMIYAPMDKPGITAIKERLNIVLTS